MHFNVDVGIRCCIHTGHLQGDELKFLIMADSICKECKAVDKDMVELPELRLVNLAFDFLLLFLCVMHRCGVATQRAWILHK